ncbi:hypothetical protein AGDE_15292 [Angomonas deanei]|nr:hypothetical protein AGDE_15292 [Angomonas deanei]|eukprot:EPY19330.1 hypothetical protein AGDE_15292 [Angomonas deanei]
MSDTFPAAFLTQWTALQQQVMEGAVERSALKQENKSLEEKYAELQQDYTELKKKHTELQKEHTELQAVNAALRREIEELKEEKHDYAEEMNNIYDRKKNELEEALKEIARLRKEHSDYEREMTATIKKVQQELADALEAKRDRLLDKYYDLSTCQCDLIGLYKYCKVYRVPEDVRRSVVAEDTREELTLPATLKEDLRGGSVGQFLEWMVVPLSELKTITGLFDSVESCYVQYKKGIVPLSVLQWYCKEYGIKGKYNFTKQALLTVTAVGTCLDYFTTVLPLLPDVTSVHFPSLGKYTVPEDRHTMIGGGSVRQFLSTVVDLLPEPKKIWGFYWYLYECYLAYKAGDISHDVLKAWCHEWNTHELYVGDSQQLSDGISLGDYCEVILPLLPRVTTIGVGPEVKTIDWCATLPERITSVVVTSCKAIEDFTPLLAMVGLRQVVYNKSTNPSFQSIIDQLRNNGVTVEEW